MIAPVAIAFDPVIDPETLFRAAVQLERHNEDAAEIMHGYAHDLATILQLPEVRREA